MQKHVGVITAQKRLMPGTFRRSEVAALVDRVQHDHPFPSWYTPDLSRPTIDFEKVQATPAVQALYDSLSRAPPRSFEFVPRWGITVLLIYSMRRVNCPECGVTVEQVP